MRWYELVVGAALILARVICLAQSFRTEVEVLPDETKILNNYRWGALASVELDVGGDGGINARYLPDRRSTGMHRQFTEGWESSRCDSVFDIHWRQDQSGRLTLEYDRDRDGHDDLRLQGDDAASFLKSLERLEKCSTFRNRRPPQGFDGVIGVATDYQQFTVGKNGKPTHGPSALFYEMAENQQRTDKLKQYADSHAHAKIREQKLRNQQPGLNQFAPGAGPVVKHQAP